MRSCLLTPTSLLLFALLNIAIGADLDSSVLTTLGGLGVLSSIGLLIRQRLTRLRIEQDVFGKNSVQPASLRNRPSLTTIAIVIGAAYAEYIVLRIATDPWVEPPPGPVRGEISAHGPDFGKGVTWRPTSCHPATNPGVTAAALTEKDDPFPLAWVIGGQNKGVAAIDVQRSAAAATIRFYPNSCTRLHGDVQPVRARSVAGDLAGYADAECVHGDDTLTMHVDFDACATTPADPAPVRPSGHASNPQPSARPS